MNTQNAVTTARLEDADHRQGRTASGPQNGHADGRLRPTEYGHQHHRLSGHHVHFKGRQRNKTDRRDEHRPRRKLERKNHYLHLGIRPIDVARTEGDSSFRRRRNQWRKPVLRLLVFATLTVRSRRNCISVEIIYTRLSPVRARRRCPPNTSPSASQSSTRFRKSGYSR